MLELFKKIDPLELLNTNKVTKEKTKFKDNIIFTSFSDKILELSDEDIVNLSYDEVESFITIKNLSKKIVINMDEEGNKTSNIKDFTFDEFLENIKNISYFSSLYAKLIEIKNANPIDYPNKIYEIISSDTLLRFNISKDNKSYVVDVLSNNSKAIGASTGQKSWTLGISYGAVKPKKDEMDFLINKLIYAHNFLNSSYIKEYNQYYTDKLDIDLISQKLETLSSNEFFKDVINKKIECLAFEKSSTQLYLTDYFGINNYRGFDISYIQNRLLEYYLNNPKTNPKFEKVQGVCRSCTKESLLIKNKNYSQIFDYSSHTFNLLKIKNGKKFVNNSVLFCEECSNSIDEINNLISSEKLHFIKIGVNGFSGGIRKYNNVSEIHTSGYENIAESVFYQIRTDELYKNANNFIPILNINSKTDVDKMNMAINFNLIQSLYGYKINEKNNKWTPNWVDVIYKNKYSKDKKSVSIERSIKTRKNNLINFWINNVKLTNAELNSILIDMLINNKLSEKSGNFYFYNMFSFMTDLSKYEGNDSFEEKIILSINNKEIEFGLKISNYDLITLKKGEETMFERHKRINDELLKLDEINDELSEIELNLSDDDFFILFGRVIGYLNSKSKSQEHSLDYLNSFKRVNTNNLSKLLENTFVKYSHNINSNQVKFKLIYSYLIENINKKSVSDSTFNSILSGALNNKIIKLIKNIKKD